MQDIEFYKLLLNNWKFFLIINSSVFLFLTIFLYKILRGKIADPLFLVLVVGFSTNYSVMFFLYLMNFIDYFLFATLVFYNVLFLIFFKIYSKKRKEFFFLKLIRFLEFPKQEYIFFKFVLSLYFIISFYVLYKSGFGIFSEYNRFESARGIGVFIRFLDLFQPFIVAFSILTIYKNRKFKLFYSFLLFLFIGYSAMLSGAKISIIFSLIVIFLALKVAYPQHFKIDIIKITLLIIVGISFALFSLKMNLIMNNENLDGSDKHIEGVSILTGKLIHRCVANGNTNYLLLPNSIIDKIDTDNIFTRFLAPIVGITNLSKLLGYDVGKYSVGRQAKLYYDDNSLIAGGPTSHLDVFAYVYFTPLGGIFFIIIIAILLGKINSTLLFFNQNNSSLEIALIVTLWTRAVIIIVEPTVGLAYILDFIFIFIFIKFFIFMLPKKHMFKRIINAK